MFMEHVGFVAVDSGTIVFADPCTGEFVAKEFDQLVENEDYDWECRQLFYGHGIEAAVIVDTGIGDGMFPVFVTRNAEGQIVEATIVFTFDEEEDEE